MNITFNLKEKHLCFIASQLFSESIQGYYNIINIIKTKLKSSTYAPEDLVEFAVKVEEFINIYTLLGRKQESIVSGINGEMKTLLISQLSTKLSNTSNVDNASAQYIYTKIGDIELKNDNIVNKQIVEGRTLLLS